MEMRLAAGREPAADPDRLRPGKRGLGEARRKCRALDYVSRHLVALMRTTRLVSAAMQPVSMLVISPQQSAS